MIHTESGGAGGPTSAAYVEGGGWGGWHPSRASQVAGDTNLPEKSDF